MFHGLVELVELLRFLYRRPRFGDGPKDIVDRTERKGRTGLPMVCLVRPLEHDELLGMLADRLADARPHRVPHAFIPLQARDPSGDRTAANAPLGHDDVRQVWSILRKLAAGLADARNSKAGRIRFRRFGLVHWLMTQTLPPAESGNRESALRSSLRKRDILQRMDDLLRGFGGQLPDEIPGQPALRGGWLRGVVTVFRLLPPVLFRLKVTGRVPLLSGDYRWVLRRQPHLTPGVPGTFLGFAERLTADEWTKEDPEQVARLLVNALLDDLRRAYRRFPWLISRKRRTTYATVLLDNIRRDNGGYTLLKLINDVRNETGLFDPLLLISASQKVPPHALDPADGEREVDPDEADDPRGHGSRRLVYSAANTHHGYQAWQHTLLEDRRARRDTAWYLPISIPGLPTSAERADVRQRLNAVDRFRVERPPWWSSRTLPVAVLIAVLAGGTVTYVANSYLHCATGLGWPSGVGSAPGKWLNPALHAHLHNLSVDQCYGVTDGSDPAIFRPASVDAPLNTAVNQIRGQNQQAVTMHRSSGRRIVTIVFLAALTPTGQNTTLTPERESLEGVAVAQDRQNENPPTSDLPLVRVLIANAGPNMEHGTDVARQLSTMHDSDDPLVGVIGLDQSSRNTEQTIRALSGASLPMVANTLSADTLSENSPLFYYQVSPRNSQEALVALAFAQNHLNLGAHRMDVYYDSDPNDVYSNNLSTDLAQDANKVGIDVAQVAFDPTVSRSPGVMDPSDAGFDACRKAQSGDLVYFAGRGLPDFQIFIDNFANRAGCGSTQFNLLADDDVGRYVAAAGARGQTNTKSVPFWYESFATSLTPQAAAQNFYSRLNSLFSIELDATLSRSGDGRAALAYDAADALIDAANEAANSLGTDNHVPISRAAVAAQLNRTDLSGATGLIQFSRHNVPPDRPVIMTHVVGGGVVGADSIFCGALTGPSTPNTLNGMSPQSWCPQPGP